MRPALSYALTAAVAVGASGCGGGSHQVVRIPRSATPLRPAPARRLPGRHYVAGCSEPRVSGGLPTDYREESAVIGPVAIYPAKSEFPRTSAGDLRMRHRIPSRFAAQEADATVATGARVTLVVPRQERRSLALLFDPSRYVDATRGYTVAEGDRAVTLSGCYKPYTQYSGGFVVTRLHCARLLVYGVRPGHAAETTLAFGRRNCRG
jgi:hypothetical protein